MMNNNLFKSVKSTANLLDEVQAVMELKKEGSGWKGCCPFHNEKTPSFSIKGDSGTFNCFGCGEKGDVITFVAKYNNLTNLAAAKKLAQKFGIPIEDGFATPNSPTLLLRLVADHWHKQFMDNATGKAAKRYLVGRGYGHDQAKLLKEWQYGYCTAQTTEELAQQIGVDAQLLTGIGLTNEDGKLLFSNRLILPIWDKMGNVIAFAGRVLDETTKPKYINSPETSLFKKGETWYGLNKAANAIKKNRNVVIVEGYFDTHALHHIGLKTAIAINGTALSHQQIHHFSSDTTFVLMLDTDQAGITATIKSIHTLLQAGMSKIAIMQPQGYKDAFECVKANNWTWEKDMFAEQSYISFLQEHQEGETLQNILDSLAHSTNLFGRDETLNTLSKVFNFSKIALIQELNRKIEAQKRKKLAFS